jgi:hypothetical protein
MPIIKRTRVAQYPLVQEFVWNFNDGVPYLSALNSPTQDANPRAIVQDFGSKVQPNGMLSGNTWQANQMSVAPTYFDMFSLPIGAQIIGGDLQIEAPYAGPSSVTLSIGDSQSAALYLTATTLMATNFTNQPTTLTNAGADPTVCTMGNAIANGITAVGQTITVAGCTGASAAYNGVFIVDSYFRSVYEPQPDHIADPGGHDRCSVQPCARSPVDSQRVFRRRSFRRSGCLARR